jgi:hypothetical protein
MKEQIIKMKLELKSIAKQIKKLKSHRKDRAPDGSGCGYVSGLNELRVAYRHKHVAYCLVRGRTLEQIDSGNGLNMDVVNWIIESMQPNSTKKLYIIVNEQLSTSQQAVQAGHAVAAFLKNNPHTQWDNGHLIYLKTKPNWKGNINECIYFSFNHETAEFCEPDMDSVITAAAVFGPYAERQLSNYKLV